MLANLERFQSSDLKLAGWGTTVIVIYHVVLKRLPLLRKGHVSDVPLFGKLNYSCLKQFWENFQIYLVVQILNCTHIQRITYANFYVYQYLTGSVGFVWSAFVDRSQPHGHWLRKLFQSQRVSNQQLVFQYITCMLWLKVADMFSALFIPSTVMDQQNAIILFPFKI